ncbi:MAG TPA: ABC transporter ATP-binding protein [Alphaproteobacteria bacterium]|jgi:branched-chain amino acid transport system ATP-binding protein|nr:ABC transporter ATP-binding protein [Alphaproteobacteria bacterium]
MPQEPPVLETRELTIRFGGHVAVNRVSCRFERGTLTAIVGPNGAGKTTYFNLISGQLRAHAGRVILNGEDVTGLSAAARTGRGIGRAFQLTNLFPNLSVLENVRLAVQARAGMGFGMLSMAARHEALIEQAEHVLARVGLLARADAPAASLPHGDQRKLEVAMLLSLERQVLMFDEPTAGMSMDEVPAVLELIRQVKADPTRTVLLVEHKMEVIRALADRIVVLHNGYLVADGEPAEVMRSPIVQEAYLGSGVAEHV